MDNEFWAATEYFFFRTHKFKSQKELAITAGVSQSVVSETLKRKKGFHENTKEKIARAFGYSLLDFLAFGRRIIEGKEPLEKRDKPTLTPTPPSSKETGLLLNPEVLEKYPFAKSICEEFEKAAKEDYSPTSVLKIIKNLIEAELVRQQEVQEKRNSAGK